VRIKELDGLRGVAVLAVIDCHYSSWLPIAGSAYGWLGINLFFVLSGFLITSILLGLREEEHYFAIFYSRRALRIFPPFYLGLAINFAISVCLGMPGTFRLWAQFVFYYISFYIHDPFPLHETRFGVPVIACYGLTVLRLLSVEEIYYTIWAPIIRFTKEKVFTAVLIFTGMNNVTDKDPQKSYATLVIVMTPHVVRGPQAAGYTAMIRVEKSGAQLTSSDLRLSILFQACLRLYSETQGEFRAIQQFKSKPLSVVSDMLSGAVFAGLPANCLDTHQNLFVSLDVAEPFDFAVCFRAEFAKCLHLASLPSGIIQ
jgi:hypothetical protein